MGVEHVRLLRWDLKDALLCARPRTLELFVRAQECGGGQSGRDFRRCELDRNPSGTSHRHLEHFVREPCSVPASAQVFSGTFTVVKVS